MPITARLSRKFYDRFGDDIVGELIDLLNLVDTASRSELRELNEANFARFDAKLEQRMTELRAEIGGLRAELDSRFAASKAELDSRFATSKEGVLRWMVGLWLTQMLAFAGLWLSRA